jgi:hypothetical protein
LILLRIFCEVYRRNGKSPQRLTVFIQSIYRSEIFDQYLELKLQNAAEQKDRIDPKYTVIGTLEKLRKLLYLITDQMIQNRSFSNIPLDAILGENETDLCVLLDEELLIRRDTNPASTRLSNPSSDVINFTYDEFRDYLLAKRILDVIYAKGKTEFEGFMLSMSKDQQQVLEGLQRFLFYLSRLPNNKEFWEYYHTHKLYNDIYASEIFSVSPEHLNVDDGTRVLEILNSESENTRFIVFALMHRWNTSVNHILSIDLLNKYFMKCGNAQHMSLLTRCFYYKEYMYSSEQDVLEIITKSILDLVEENIRSEIYHGLFLFCVFLLPAGLGSRRDYIVSSFLRRIGELYPQECIDALSASLASTSTCHWASVFHLLSGMAPLIHEPDLLIHKALSVIGHIDRPITICAQQFLDSMKGRRLC